ncbi:MAG: signal recognition particle protein [Candidatus Paraimprobicoccus trichonymphae]|uniref:Signal recognition particle protein n=1 Tax=Candidatus Paraimprobicoccus trichonymphae TaxID=3033793 RepID=A0AA48L1A6_9FIRM|nr:MAG: signal recognition particle protein [Candidatus Paraimprobicoccus trichonymphae]
MAFESLSEKLSQVFKKLTSKGKLTEKYVTDSMREVRMALLEADVSFKVAKEFTNKITERAIGSKILESLTPSQMVIKLVNEELAFLMGDDKSSRIILGSKPPSIIMMCGLQGSGKTTHSAKLAKLFKKQGHRPLLVACDIYRPAAIKQLQVLGNSIKVNVFEFGEISPVEIAKKSVSYSKDYGNDIIILDTAGRLHIDKNLMDELENIKEAVKPNEILLVLDSMTGQDAVKVAENFNSKLDITGIILTKLDGDARGGAALSVKSVTGKSVKFVGTGEKLDDLETFHPDRMASRILGMGDILTLIEEAESKFDKKQAEKLAEKLEKNNFDLNDLRNQIIQMKKMGSIKSIISKLPGVNDYLKNVDLDDKILDRTCAIILSMTEKEKKRPEIITPSRKKRIALGSGMKVEDVNKLLRQFEQMHKVMKQFGSKKFSKFRFTGF